MADMQSKTTRRLFLRSAGVLPAVAIMPAVAVASFDPIYAAIETHRTAWLEWSTALRISCALVDGTPEHDLADARSEVLGEAETHAAVALTNVVPLTIAGALALLEYVDEFNAGGVTLGDEGWSSEHEQWPNDLVDAGVVDDDGAQRSMPFAFWLLRNVQRTLKSLVSA